MGNIIFGLHLFSCFFMTGVIYLIQLVHYPSYRFIDAKNFIPFEQFHVHKITPLVFPVMLVELLSGGFLFYQDKKSWMFASNFALLLLTWLSTLVFSMAAHNRLSVAYDKEDVRKLIQTNWIRTILWSVRAVILFYVLMRKV